MTSSINKKFFLKLAIILSLFFGFFLGFNNGSVYALDDVSQTWNSTVSLRPYYNLFPNCDVDCASQYSYLKITYSTAQLINTPLSTFFCGLDFRLPRNQSEVYFSVPSNCTEVTGHPGSLILANYSTSLIVSSGDSITFTYTNQGPSQGISPEGSLSITENGTYNVTSYSQAVVDVPQTINEVIEDPISNDFQKVFFKIVENIIPAFGILLVVWFGIDMLSSLIFGRGR